MKISQKIILIVVVGTTIAIVLTVYNTHNNIKNILQKNIGDSYAEIGRQTLEKIDLLMLARLDDVKSYATRPLVRDYLNNLGKNSSVIEQELIISLRDTININRYFNHLTVFNISGQRVLSSDESDETLMFLDEAVNDLFKQALKGQAGVSDLHEIVGHSSSSLMVFVAPVMANEQSNKVVGVVIGEVDSSSIFEALTNVLSPQIYIYNQDNKLIASNQTTNQFLNSEYILGPVFQQNNSFILSQTESPNGQEMLVVHVSEVGYKEFSGHNWFLLLANPTAEAFAPAVAASWSIAIYTIPAVVVIIIIVLVLILYFIIRPLRKITIAVKGITEGDLESKVDVKTNDEIGLLAKGFNSMVEKLVESRNKLEERVRAKTIELDNNLQKIEKQNQSLLDNRRAILNILSDIEQEKDKTEGLAKDLQKFKLAVDEASDHIVITDPEGIILYGNRAVEKITGYKVKDVLGKKAGVAWHTPMPTEFYEKMWKTIKEDKRVFTGELQNRRKGGEVYEAQISISPVLNRHGDISFFVGIERDITREKQVDKAKTEFVSLASHQLRTPLSAINWYTEMLLDGDAGKINKEQKQYLEEIYHGNQRMVELVNALLNVSRLELGTFMVEPEAVDIREIAAAAISEIMPQINTKQIKFIKKFTNDIPQIMLDKKLIHILFQNFLSNAVKYTPEKGQITLEIKKPDNKCLLVAIKDNGYGIPESQRDRIFTKLFRADNVREKDAEGTGLGLYLAKSIIVNAGGTVWFESEENKGTTFFFTIPLIGMKPKAGSRQIS